MKRGQLTSTVVIRAAADLADEDGFGRVTLAEVALRLGVRTPSLYTHVRDRTALLDGVHELALDELADRIASAVAGRSGRAALVGLAEAQRRYAQQAPGRWASLIRPIGPDEPRSAAAIRLFDLVVAVLRGYSIAEGELEHVTRFLDASINGFVGLEHAGNLAHHGPDVEQSWQRLLAVLHAALERWSEWSHEPDRPNDGPVDRA
ncbi:MAG: TetR/AcrR family transcriptional regulator [Propionibacteriaceae bacterium]|nr:MAG: TetR/AcrR family transcriptional regulator [Propionibacteriaceae bacterium]